MRNSNMASLSLTDPLVQSYILYSTILGLKLLAMAVLTGKTRYKKLVFANEEDAKNSKGKVKFDDPDVERVRRAHRNDLENIPVFWLIGAFYVTTAPAAALATLLFRIFTIARFIHTFVYVIIPMPQPSRAIAFMVPYMITIYMGAQVILYYLSAL